MKILVDSCAWSILLRRKSKALLSDEEQSVAASLAEAIREGRVVMIGPIRQEVLSGIKEPAQFQKLRSALEAFPDEPITTAHYEEAARLYNLCRSRGVECGPIDILLCALAIRERWKLLTNDGGILRCIEALLAKGVSIPVTSSGVS
jgi:hypothetical protein